MCGRATLRVRCCIASDWVPRRLSQLAMGCCCCCCLDHDVTAAAAAASARGRVAPIDGVGVTFTGDANGVLQNTRTPGDYHRALCGTSGELHIDAAALAVNEQHTGHQIRKLGACPEVIEGDAVEIDLRALAHRRGAGVDKSTEQLGGFFTMGNCK